MSHLIFRKQIIDTLANHAVVANISIDELAEKILLVMRKNQEDNTLLTVAEVAVLTGQAESTIRNRCAGQDGYRPLPGAKKRGKAWLIPVAVLKNLGELSYDWHI